MKATCRSFFSSALFAMVLAVFSGSAAAGFLGNTVRVETQFPSIGSVCCGASNVVVGLGAELPAGSFPSYNSNAYVDLGDTTIEVGQTANTSYVSAAFNGWHFFDVFATIDPIIGVSLQAESGLPGFDMSRVTFDADNVYINLADLSASNAHFVRINVVFDRGGNIPEPGSLALIGLALGALGIARRRLRA